MVYEDKDIEGTLTTYRRILRNLEHFPSYLSSFLLQGRWNLAWWKHQLDHHP